MIRAWWYALGASVGSLLALFALAPYWLTGRWGGDFYSYWELWRMALAGRSPYEPGAYCRWLIEGASPVLCAGAPGPAPFVLLLSPLGALDVWAGAFAFTLAGVALGLTGLYAVLVRERVQLGVGYALAGLAAMSADTAMVSLGLGQWGHFALAAWCWGWVGARHGWLIALVKPQLAGGMALAAFASWSWTARAAIAGAALLFIGLTWELWLAWAVGLAAAEWHGYSASLWRWIGRNDGAVLAASALLLALTVRELWLVVPVAWIAVAPYAHGYDMLWLLGPLAVVAARTGRWAVPLAVVAYMVAADALARVARSAPSEANMPGGRDEAWTVLLPLAVLALVALRLWRGVRRGTTVVVQSGAGASA